MNIKRVLVIGCPGSGKTRLTSIIKNILKLPVIHLDHIYWADTWIRPNKISWHNTLVDLINKDAWIIDGNYLNTLGLRLSKCDLVIFLDYPVYRCIWNAFKRYILWSRSSKYYSEEFQLNRPSIKKQLYLFKLIYNFKLNQRDEIYRLLAKYNKIHIIINNKTSLNIFIEKLAYNGCVINEV